MKTIVNGVRTMNHVVNRKDLTMKKEVLNRVRKEMRDYREYLVTGQFTAEQLYGKAYQIVVKQEIVDAVERMWEENLLSDEVWSWLHGKDEILEYIYQLLVNSEFSLQDEFIELVRKEVEQDKEVHKNEQ